VAIDFAHMDAAATDFPDASFDLIVSTILFHETSEGKLRAVLKECWRLLGSGGLVLHTNVPYQPHWMRLVKQVTNDLRLRYNDEPFWSGLAALDMHAKLLAAGFDPASAFADYEALGVGRYFFSAAASERRFRLRPASC